MIQTIMNLVREPGFVWWVLICAFVAPYWSAMRAICRYLNAKADQTAATAEQIKLRTQVNAW